MTLYEQITRDALPRLRAGQSPRDAWDSAAAGAEASESARQKSCPRAAFIGLAEGGHIRGVEGPGREELPKNAAYVLKGAELLRAHPELRESRTELWAAIRHATGTQRKNQNGVVDVLLALLDAGALGP